MDTFVFIILLLFLMASIIFTILVVKFAEWNGWKDGSYHNENK